MVWIGLVACKAIRISLSALPQAPSASFSMARTTFKPTCSRPNFFSIGISLALSSCNCSSTCLVCTPAASKPSFVPLTLMPGVVRLRSPNSTSARLPNAPPRSAIVWSSCSSAWERMFFSASVLLGNVPSFLPPLVTVCFSTLVVFLPSGIILSGVRRT